MREAGKGRQVRVCLASEEGPPSPASPPTLPACFLQNIVDSCNLLNCCLNGLFCLYIEREVCQKRVGTRRQGKDKVGRHELNVSPLEALSLCRNWLIKALKWVLGQGVTLAKLPRRKRCSKAMVGQCKRIYKPDWSCLSSPLQ